MVRRLSFILAMLVMLPLIGTTAAQAREIILNPGMQKFIKEDRIVIRVAIADEGVAEVVAVSDHELRVLGKSYGRTAMSVWVLKDGTEDQEQRYDFLVTVKADTETLRRLLDRDPSLTGLDVRTEKGRTYLVGTAESEAALERARALVTAILGKRFVDLARVAGPDMVAVDVRFAAVSVSTLKSLGFDFRVLGGDIVGAATAPSTLSSFDLGKTALDLTAGLPINDAFNLLIGKPGANILGVISALNGTDLAQVLAEPTLQVKSGEEASFLAGGEVPIPVPQGTAGSGTVTIEYKPFGVKLDVEPRIVEGGKIELKISPEVSELDYANALTLQGFNVPALRRRSTTTTVALEDGQSFVLAGLMMNSTANIEERVPGLGDIPILGAFFKRMRAVKESQELIIIATPRLISSETGKQVPVALPGETLINYRPTTGDFLLGTNDLEDKLKYQGLLP